MSAVSTERMCNKDQRNTLIFVPKAPFFRFLCFFVLFCIFGVVNNPELWLIDCSTPAGPLSQDMLSLGGFFIFRGAV